MDLADGDSVFIRDGMDITGSVLAKYIGGDGIEDPEPQYVFVSSTGQYANIYFDSVSQTAAQGFLVSVKSGNRLYFMLHTIYVRHLYMMCISVDKGMNCLENTSFFISENCLIH